MRRALALVCCALLAVTAGCGEDEPEIPVNPEARGVGDESARENAEDAVRVFLNAVATDEPQLACARLTSEAEQQFLDGFADLEAEGDTCTTVASEYAERLGDDAFQTPQVRIASLAGDTAVARAPLAVDGFPELRFALVRTNDGWRIDGWERST